MQPDVVKGSPQEVTEQDVLKDYEKVGIETAQDRTSGPLRPVPGDAEHVAANRRASHDKAGRAEMDSGGPSPSLLGGGVVAGEAIPLEAQVRFCSPPGPRRQSHIAPRGHDAAGVSGAAVTDREAPGEEQKKLPGASKAAYGADVARSRTSPMARRGPEPGIYLPPRAALSKHLSGDVGICAHGDQATAPPPLRSDLQMGAFSGPGAGDERFAISSAVVTVGLGLPADMCAYGSTGISGVLGGSVANNPIAVRMLKRRARRYASPTGSGQELSNEQLHISSEDVEITDGLDTHNNSNTLRQQQAQPEDTRQNVSQTPSSARGIYGQFFGSSASSSAADKSCSPPDPLAKTFLVPSVPEMSDKNDSNQFDVQISVAKPRKIQQRFLWSPILTIWAPKVALQLTL